MTKTFEPIRGYEIFCHKIFRPTNTFVLVMQMARNKLRYLCLQIAQQRGSAVVNVLSIIQPFTI